MIIIPDPNKCPQHLRESLARYVEDGVPLGDFLRAVICNDLLEAFGRADNTNMVLLPHICSFVYNHVPRRTRGSEQVYESWIRSCRRPEHVKIGLADLELLST